jgi:hypothetical protein
MTKLIFAVISALGLTVAFQSVSAEISDFPYSVAGFHWSKDLGKQASGCATPKACTLSHLSDADGFPLINIEESEAAALCAQIGGRLPTRAEAVDLVRSFKEHSETRVGFPELYVPAGQAALSLAFGTPSTPVEFWTSSSTVKSDPTVAYVFSKTNIDHTLWRRADASIRCVSK